MKILRIGRYSEDYRPLRAYISGLSGSNILSPDNFDTLNYKAPRPERIVAIDRKVSSEYRYDVRYSPEPPLLRLKGQLIGSEISSFQNECSEDQILVVDRLSASPVILTGYLEHYLRVTKEFQIHYKGKSVPITVLEEMRESEGISEEDWRGRGRVVSSDIWEILVRAGSRVDGV